MLRSEKEITDLDDICRIIGRSKVLRLALNNSTEGWPYIVPLSFGFELDGTDLIFYVHGAVAGQKWELAAQDNRVTIELDNMFGIIDGPGYDPCQVSTAYDSVIGQGVIEPLEGTAAKAEAMGAICGHYGVEAAVFPEKKLAATAAYRIRVS